MNKILACFLVVLVTTLGGCKKELLDVKNENTFTDATYFKTPTQFNETIIATYAVLYQPGMMTREWYFIFDLLANDGGPTVNLLGNLLELSEYSFSGSNTSIANLWASLYRMNLRANFAMKVMKDWMPANAAEETLKKQYIAEAKWLRGYAYFNLVTNWGRVPLRLTYEESEQNSVARKPVADVWKVVEDDFTAAIPDLPVDYATDQLGRITKGAAVAMLGKAYLFQKKYDLAAAQFTLLTKAPYHYILDPSYEDLFTDKNITSPEVVFAVNHYYVPGSSTSGNREATSRTTHTARAQEYGFNDWDNIDVSPPLVATFAYAHPTLGTPYIDPRAKFVYYGTPASGGDLNFCDKCSSGPKPYPYAFFGQRYKKYEPYETQEFTESTKSSINTHVIRYADVLLMLAECLNEKPSPDAAAATGYINAVRNRPGILAANYPATGNQATVRNWIIRERRLELAGEQVRWFDLNRWGTAKQVLSVEHPAGVSQRAFEDKHVLLPIPITERTANAALAADVANDWN